MSTHLAAGASRFRRPGVLERIAGRLARSAAGPVLRRRFGHLYHAALFAQTRRKGLVSTLPGGERVHVLPEYGYLCWNPDEYRAFRQAAGPGSVALDIGANVGAYALLLGQWVGPGGAVFAFEPAPLPFEGLTRHVALNHLTGVVHPERAAVGSTTTTAPFVVARTLGEGRLASSRDAGATIDVPVTTVDAYCAEHRLAPDFIKVDVEGNELAVLQGARETIRNAPDSLALFVEMHPSLWPALGITRDDVLAELGAQSLQAAPLVPTDDMWAIEGLPVRLRRR
jgi:FkbM family methyltransferase